MLTKFVLILLLLSLSGECWAKANKKLASTPFEESDQCVGKNNKACPNARAEGYCVGKANAFYLYTISKNECLDVYLLRAGFRGGERGNFLSIKVRCSRFLIVTIKHFPLFYNFFKNDNEEIQNN